MRIDTQGLADHVESYLDGTAKVLTNERDGKLYVIASHRRDAYHRTLASGTDPHERAALGVQSYLRGLPRTLSVVDVLVCHMGRERYDTVMEVRTHEREKNGSYLVGIRVGLTRRYERIMPRAKTAAQR